MEWAKGPIGVDFAASEIKLAYKQNATFIQTTAQDHDFFTNLENFLKDSSQAYLGKTGAELFMGDLPSPKLIVKPYESVINKSFRYNVLENSNFPAPPPGDWASPNNWFLRFDDTVRSTMVCKFIDGPLFLAEKLKEYAEGYGLVSRFASKQKDDGYYAYHYYVKLPVELFLSGAPTVVDVDIEIQLSTQLQDVMYDITHRYYEGLRIQKEVDPGAWKWEVGSNRFRAGYLSHTLHLLEGIILELRNGDRPAVGADEATPEVDDERT